MTDDSTEIKTQVTVAGHDFHRRNKDSRWVCAFCGLARTRVTINVWPCLSASAVRNRVAQEYTVPPLVAPQPDPVANDKPAVWDLVVADMKDRDADGLRKYGVRLQPANGRDAMVDAYQEALDLVVYFRQLIWERDNA